MAPGALINIDSEPQLEQLEHVSVKTKSAVAHWPHQLRGDLVWTGVDFPDEKAYTLSLNAEEAAEVEHALDIFKSQGLDGDEVDTTVFPLPRLSTKLYACARQVHQGRGFVKISGLRPERFSAEDQAVIFLGISSYIGERRGKQDATGNMLIHVHKMKETWIPEHLVPIRYSNHETAFHTDGICDILALQVRDNAALGGEHMISSAWKIYNDIAATRPDVLETLASSNWHHTHMRELYGEGSRPLIFYEDSRFILNCEPDPMRGYSAQQQGNPSVSSPPPGKLSPVQEEALDVVQAAAAANKLTLALQPGDLVFVNNLAVMHARQAFQDGRASERHLVRLWLRNEALAWRLPRELHHGHARVYEENEIEEVWNVLPVPMVSTSFPTRFDN